MKESGAGPCPNPGIFVNPPLTVPTICCTPLRCDSSAVAMGSRPSLAGRRRGDAYLELQEPARPRPHPQRRGAIAR
jgi:hypothetical protein